MEIGIIPGSFNPPTLGHLDLIQRASKLVEKLYVAIADNRQKKNLLFSGHERKMMLQTITKDLPNVEVICFNGLLIDLVKSLEATCLIKGLRNGVDFDYENQYAYANKKMCGIETIFLIADERFASLSSTLMREIASYGKHLHGFVPKEIEELIFQRIASNL